MEENKSTNNVSQFLYLIRPTREWLFGQFPKERNIGEVVNSLFVARNFNKMVCLLGPYEQNGET
jgi:hypothetical protein